MIAYYPMLKHLHMTLALVSLLLFVYRWSLALGGSERLQQKWLKILPHITDPFLLLFGILLAVSLQMNPGQQPWLMGKLIAVRDIAFEANFSGSAGHVGTNPDATFDIDVKDDGVSIGTISVSTGGAFTFTTTSGTAKTVAAGSRIEFTAPANSPAEATVADIAATLKGTA